MSVQTLVNRAVEQINKSAEVATESRVTNLVNKIITAEFEIVKFQKVVVDAKAELKALELPTPVTLDL